MRRNTVIRFVLVAARSVSLFSYKKDDDMLTEGSSNLEQFTPDQVNWVTFASKPFEGGINTAHDPDGVGWITEEQWANAKWDGTIYNPSEMTH
jgi:hypothetical protein